MPGGIPTACQHLHCQLMLELRESQDIGLLHLVVYHIGIQYSGLQQSKEEPAIPSFHLHCTMYSLRYTSHAVKVINRPETTSVVSMCIWLHQFQNHTAMSDWV